MVGVGAGDARLILEVGDTRLVATEQRVYRGDVTAETLQVGLQRTVAQLERQLARIEQREERES